MLRTLYIKLSQASVLIPVIAGIIHYKKIPQSYKVLLWFFIASIGFEIQASVLKVVYQNNMPGLHLFTLVECLAFSSVYYRHFKNKHIKLFIIINTLFFGAACLIDAFLVHGIWMPNTIARSYGSLSIISYTLLYFRFMFGRDIPDYNSRHPLFWISTGALIYFGANLLYFMLTTYLIRQAAQTAVYSLFFHAAINIVSNSFYARSFQCFKTQKMTW